MQKQVTDFIRTVKMYIHRGSSRQTIHHSFFKKGIKRRKERKTYYEKIKKIEQMKKASKSNTGKGR